MNVQARTSEQIPGQVPPVQKSKLRIKIHFMSRRKKNPHDSIVLTCSSRKMLLGKCKSSKKTKVESTREELHVVVGKILKKVDFNTVFLFTKLLKSEQTWEVLILLMLSTSRLKRSLYCWWTWRRKSNSMQECGKLIGYTHRSSGDLLKDEENSLAFEAKTRIEPADFVIYFDCPEEERKRRFMRRNQVITSALIYCIQKQRLKISLLRS